MKKYPKFFGFHYIFIEEDCWRFSKMDDSKKEISNLHDYRNNIMKNYGDLFWKISKIIESKYL